VEDNRSLLIVDDEPETLKGYSEFLSPSLQGTVKRSSRSAASPDAPVSKDSFRLLLAKSGEEAVEIFKAEKAAGRRVAAGFFDVKLGAGMDGLATIQAIKAIDPEIFCVIVTAYHDRTVDEINELFGEDFKDHWDYLNKPFTRGEIVQKARQMTAAWNRKQKLDAVTQQLIRSERLAAIGQVARGIGHEFGNILMRIMGKSDLALGEKDVTKIHEHLQVVLKASERAGVIVRNLQSFSKAEPSFQVAEVSVPLEEAISLLNHEFVKHSVKLVKNIQQVGVSRIDVGGLAQVFLNLMINAVHAMPQGGELKVSVQPLAQEGTPGIEIRVADSGVGIPPDVLPRIFEFAFSTKGDQGSGIGLSVSREIVEGHGGRISLKSEPGKGTEFAIWIPKKA
jgi:signal transduction histidine kinase